MTDKIEVLLKLNKIMKQQAEKNLAEAMRHIKDLSNKTSEIHHKIQQQNIALYNSQEGAHVQSDVKVFEQWKRAQLKRLSDISAELQQAEASKSELVLELKTQTVRQDMLTAQLKKSQVRKADERDELTDERNLEGWLNQNRFA
ncbi:hypothetical protein [Litorimonas sp.]|uniref:hypothetical protein n=1 Tax=Litorimonas sp. TaxID=1892381 RepID=UPI003A848529